MKLYRWLVRLHPPAFRERFGAEMLCVYDDAPRNERAALLSDAIVSLGRQWVARSSYWIIGAAALGALLQFTLAGTAWLGAARRAIGAVSQPNSQAPSAQMGALLVGAGLVCGVLLLTTALASLVGGGARRKS